MKLFPRKWVKLYTMVSSIIFLWLYRLSKISAVVQILIILCHGVPVLLSLSLKNKQKCWLSPPPPPAKKKNTVQGLWRLLDEQKSVSAENVNNKGKCGKLISQLLSTFSSPCFDAKFSLLIAEVFNSKRCKTVLYCCLPGLFIVILN